MVPRAGLIATYRPQRAAAEQIIYVRNVRAAVALAQVRGALVAACSMSGLTMDEYGPTGQGGDRPGAPRRSRSRRWSCACCAYPVPQNAAMRWRWRSLAAYSATHRALHNVSPQGAAAPRSKAWEAFVKERKT